MSSSPSTLAGEVVPERGGSLKTPQRPSIDAPIDAPAAVHHRDLPLLGMLLDKDAMTWTIRNSAEVNPALRGATVTWAKQMSHRTGRRALIAYRLVTPGGTAPVRVLGKHFSEPIRAARLYTIKEALWAHASHQGCGFVTAQPLGLLPHLGLALFAPVQGEPLDRALSRHPMDQSLRRCAESVAALHALELSLDRHLDIVDEWANLQSWAATVEAAYPEHGGAVRDIARRLTNRAPEQPARQATIHKDLHYRHLVLGARPAFIDLDEMRVGDPSFDLAHFSVHLDLLGLRMSSSPRSVEALRRSFLDPYSDLTGWVEEEAFVYFSAYSCLKIARQLCTRSGVRPRPRGAERRRQLQEVVSKGASLAEALG